MNQQNDETTIDMINDIISFMVNVNEKGAAQSINYLLYVRMASHMSVIHRHKYDVPFLSTCVICLN